MTQEKTKKGPPIQILPNKQIFPLIGLGTYKLTEKSSLIEIVKKAVQIGYRHIDTARFYNNQIELGQAIQICINQGRCKRQDLFIASKTFNHVDKNPVLQLKQILKLMNLSYIDLYYIHWPVSGLDSQGKWTHRQICQVWKDMQQCVRKGYTKHIGVSNFNGQNIMDLLSYAKIKPIANQIQYHPYLQQHNLVQLCQKNGITVIAYTPLARAAEKQDDNIFKEEFLIELAQKYNKTIPQIVLKSTLSRGIGVIPKTQNLNRLQQNFESWNFELTQDQLKKLKDLNKNLRIIDGKRFFKDAFQIFD